MAASVNRLTIAVVPLYNYGPTLDLFVPAWSGLRPSTSAFGVQIMGYVEIRFNSKNWALD
ncbi:hypothetical protein K443DRAFT_281979 [Laccaria amethystina LaAM-08-1]|uniref:Uncharacterized protein n=1 Tax=Laccaria amethystina LaAM-08-1 TaxID=1095629 RepID=A0A0C9WVL9_9AGAR|nr:hypothetical protein K443DRAFT_281979 [Laccaria amethystina LaAM-08-1]